MTSARAARTPKRAGEAVRRSCGFFRKQPALHCDAQRREHEHYRNHRPTQHTDNDEDGDSDENGNWAPYMTRELHADEERHADADGGESAKHSVRDRRATEARIEITEHEDDAEGRHHHAERRRRAADAAAKLRADIDREVHRVRAGQHLRERESSDEMIFVQPAAPLHDLAVKPCRGTAAEARDADAREHNDEREKRYRSFFCRRFRTHEIPMLRHTSNLLNLVWFSDLKFLNVNATRIVGTSNPPHERITV